MKSLILKFGAAPEPGDGSQGGSRFKLNNPSSQHDFQRGWWCRDAFPSKMRGVEGTPFDDDYDDDDDRLMEQLLHYLVQD